MKYIQINGVTVSESIDFFVVYNELTFKFSFISYSEYEMKRKSILNPDDINKCDMVVEYSSMGNNSIEVYYIKIFLSILYFAYRIDIEEKRKEKFFSEEREYGFDNAFIYKKYLENESPVTKNWNTRGFWNIDYIENIHWCVKLGRTKMDSDDFESYLSRAYNDNLCDFFDQRFIFRPYRQEIKINDEIVKHIEILNDMINVGDVMGNKIKSAMRLYYELFMVYTNMNLSIITLSTIMETLLLGKDEDNQRKKVSVRAACLVCDGMKKKWKSAIGDTVYFFYKYRNAIVHDGKSYLDFEEVILNNIVENMKHIIFGIVYFYYKKSPCSISDIKDVVTRNQNQDRLTNAFDYLSPEAGERYCIILPED